MKVPAFTVGELVTDTMGSDYPKNPRVAVNFDGSNDAIEVMAGDHRLIVWEKQEYTPEGRKHWALTVRGVKYWVDARLTVSEMGELSLSGEDHYHQWHSLSVRRFDTWSDNVSSSAREAIGNIVFAVARAVMEKHPDFLKEGAKADLTQELSRARADTIKANKAYIEAKNKQADLEARLKQFNPEWKDN